nr:FAR1 DNA binding domain, zinc finger, SWIM-type, MULE transposase domain, FHY3/FAR1 family [Tanacetum cinerariifolium]
GILDVTPRGSKYWIPDVEDKPVKDKFVQRHNHYLVDKENLQFLRSCRKLTFSQKVLIHQISNLNMGPVRVFKLMKEMYKIDENDALTGLFWSDEEAKHKISPEAFEEKWASRMTDFNLQENKWHYDMYQMRGKWIPAYLCDEPMTGLMRTSS